MGYKTVVLNGQKMNYDGKLDFSGLSDIVTVYDDTTPEEVPDRIRDADIVVTKEMPVSAELIESFPENVRLICEAGTGYNNIDMAAAKKKGITVCNIPAYSSQRVAHTAIMLMLNLSSSMQIQMSMLAKGDHSNFTDHLKVPHVELNGKVLGLIGAGNIGMEVAKVARALGMEVLIYRRHPGEDTEGMSFVSLEELLRKSDYISLHCPLTDETRHLINKDTISLMKESAFIINTSRGAVINEADLIEALKENRIAGAGLDVQEHEPLSDDSLLYGLPNVILTPHMGWKGLETRQRLVGLLEKNIAAFIAGEPVNVVSK